MNDLILNSFSDELPCGNDCKYEDSFLLIEQEVDNSSSANREEATDWSNVQKHCEDFLSKESKDLKIASWLVYSLWKNDSWKGLERGLFIYNKLLDLYLDNIYPKSKRAKTNIFSWLEDALNKDILVYEKDTSSIIKEDSLLKHFNDLNTYINKHLEEENNNFRKIIKLLNSLVTQKNIEIVEVKKNKTIIEKNNTIANIKVTEVVKAPQIIETTDIINDQDAIKVLRRFKKDASLLSQYYRKENISDFKALRITRLLTWLDTEGLPTSENHKTFLHPPAELEIDELRALYKNKEYEDAFYIVEEILEVSPFWIDGHYYSYNILEKTKNFEQAKEVKNTLISFLQTNEGILNLNFTDDTAFASSKTKKWIQEEFNSKEEVTSTKEEQSEDFYKETLNIVEELTNDNKVKEAMSILSQKFNTASSTQEKFNWRLYHAELAVEFDKKEIALALLEELESYIEKYNLNEWNPKLASRVYSLLLTSFSNIEIHTDKQELLYKNLCKTDINSAFEIKLN